LICSENDVWKDANLITDGARKSFAHFSFPPVENFAPRWEIFIKNAVGL